jgi:hypothetical protein
MNQLQTLGDTVMASFQTFFAFLPALIGAIIVLIIGWFVAKLIGKLVEKVLTRVGFERAAEHSGIGQFVRRSGSRTTSQIVAQLAKWFVFLIFVQGAASILAMPQLTNIINSIVLFIPKLIVAVAIIVAAALIGEFLAGLVRAATGKAGIGNPDVLAKITQYIVIGFGLIAASNQIGIATNVVNTLLIGFVGSIALAFGLAFGLGGRDVAASITSSWYEHTRAAAQRMRTETTDPATKRVWTERKQDIA